MFKLKSLGKDKSPDIEAAAGAIEREIDGLKALENALDEKFVKAVEIIFGLKGKLITSGMGKSGHVARKIAATFASTGTPSFYVHPGEASHGDLGMITKDDGLLLLSNSGETAELKSLIDYAKRFSIPLIGMVRRETSQLVDAADVSLVLPEIPEALPAAAPSTSTTMMMALGDALAASLMHRHGFGEEDFGTFHPGGKLGKQFIKVEEIMRKHDDLPIVADYETMRDILPLMTAKSLGCAVVTNSSGKLLGIITDGDLRRHLENDMLGKKAAEVMSKNPTTIRPNALAMEALGIMNEKKITSLLIVEDGKAVGLVHIHDILRAGIS